MKNLIRRNEIRILSLYELISIFRSVFRPVRNIGDITYTFTSVTFETFMSTVPDTRTLSSNRAKYIKDIVTSSGVCILCVVAVGQLKALIVCTVHHSK